MIAIASLGSKMQMFAYSLGVFCYYSFPASNPSTLSPASLRIPRPANKFRPWRGAGGLVPVWEEFLKAKLPMTGRVLESSNVRLGSYEWLGGSQDMPHWH